MPFYLLEHRLPFLLQNNNPEIRKPLPLARIPFKMSDYPFTPGDILELSSLYGCLHYAIHVSGQSLGDDRYEARIIHVAGPDSEEMPYIISKYKAVIV